MKNIKWFNLLLELLVVIFGVTIAFSLNTWKENRRTSQLEREYLMSYKYDLEKDTVQLLEYIDTLTIHKDNCGKLIGMIFSNNFEDESLLTNSLSLFFVTNFMPHSATYKSMTSSGQLQLIKDFDLRKRIVDLYDVDHAEIALIDEFNKDQVFDYKIPFLHDNIQYGRRAISNTEVLTSSKYINMTMSTFYFLDRKINMYRETLETSRELIIDIDKKLKD